jgi:hypothetical protein
MKLLSLASVIILAIISSSCTTENHNYYTTPPMGYNLVASPTSIVYLPYQIEVYDDKHLPSGRYKPIGVVSTTKFNEYGIMKQQATVDETLRVQASQMGGDAIIMVPSIDKNMHIAQVIKYDAKPSKSAPNTQAPPIEN